MLVGVAHAVPEKDGIKSLGQCRKNQAPDTEVNKVLIDLGAGSKAAAKLSRKRNKSDSQSQRHFAFIDQKRMFLAHNSNVPLYVFL